MTSKEEIWDVAVIGGGPAGMMAAGRAAERGAKVILLEKNEKLGKKLLITGGGRCNLTNAEFDNRKLLSKFGEAEPYLFSPFSEWSVKDTLNFFESRGLSTKVENEGRVFPTTDKALSVFNVLFEYLKDNGVTIRFNSEVTGLEAKEGLIESVRLADGTCFKARSFILATGGRSHPETGSTGEGFEWLRSLGHTVHEPKASLVPVALSDAWIRKLSGTSLQTAKLTVYQNDVKQFERRGRVLFTHFGISGPTVINMSQDLSELLKYGGVDMKLDLFPNMDPGALNLYLQNLLQEENNKKIKNSITKLVPGAMSEMIFEKCGIPPEKWNNTVSRKERLGLVELLKSIPLSVKGLLGEEKAIVTSGGVDLNEVDFRTMSSRLFPNLYLIGDVLNIDRPSGGYSLQLCWTTGQVAGMNIPLTEPRQ